MFSAVAVVVAVAAVGISVLLEEAVVVVTILRRLRQWHALCG